LKKNNPYTALTNKCHEEETKEKDSIEKQNFNGKRTRRSTGNV